MFSSFKSSKSSIASFSVGPNNLLNRPSRQPPRGGETSESTRPGVLVSGVT